MCEVRGRVFPKQKKPSKNNVQKVQRQRPRLLHRQWAADLENRSAGVDNDRLKLIKTKSAHCISSAKRQMAPL